MEADQQEHLFKDEMRRVCGETGRRGVRASIKVAQGNLCAYRIAQATGADRAGYDADEPRVQFVGWSSSGHRGHWSGTTN